MGEYERSYLVFRATVESNFQRESGVAGFLEAQGQFVRSVDVLSRLLREYPPEGYVAEASLFAGAARLRQGGGGGRRQTAAAGGIAAAGDVRRAACSTSIRSRRRRAEPIPPREAQPRRPAPPRLGDVRELLDGLSRRSGRRSGRAGRRRRAAGPEGVQGRRRRVRSRMPSDTRRANCSTPTGT